MSASQQTPRVCRLSHTPVRTLWPCCATPSSTAAAAAVLGRASPERPPALAYWRVAFFGNWPIARFETRVVGGIAAVCCGAGARPVVRRRSVDESRRWGLRERAMEDGWMFAGASGVYASGLSVYRSRSSPSDAKEREVAVREPWQESARLQCLSTSRQHAAIRLLQACTAPASRKQHRTQLHPHHAPLV